MKKQIQLKHEISNVHSCRKWITVQHLKRNLILSHVQTNKFQIEHALAFVSFVPLFRFIAALAQFVLIFNCTYLKKYSIIAH